MLNLQILTGIPGRDLLIPNFVKYSKTLLGVQRHRVKRWVGSIMFILLKSFCTLLKPSIVLTYSNTLKPDGVGAQLQRLLALRSLCEGLDLGYKHTEIASVAIHPLDSYQSLEEMEYFVSELNHEFFMRDRKFDATLETVEIRASVLKFKVLWAQAIRSVLLKKQIVIHCVEPYSVAECDPKIYSKTLEYLPNFIPLQRTARTLAIHYRRGVGGFSVQIGEKLPREISSKYFTSVVREIIHTSTESHFRLLIFTDAPSSDITFKPPANQLDLWKNSQRFSEGEMQVVGLDLEEIFRDVTSSTEVVYGGNPLQVIKRLASMDHLVLSRSSFGYVAAILNTEGNIYFPSGFWHIPKKGWNVIKEANHE